jgi:hypothetical protein
MSALFMSKEILEILPKTKCEKCGKPAIQITMTMMMGSNGFRRYPVCAKCLETLQASQPKNQPHNLPKN